MSDMAQASLSPQQRRRPSNHDSIYHVAPAAAAVMPQSQLAEETSTSLDLVLSLQDGLYSQIMYEEFKILGESNDQSLEENIAVELFTQLKKEGARFYVMGKGGHRSRVEDEEAFEIIKRDIKMRSQSAHNWLEKSATNNESSVPVIPLMPDNFESSGGKITPDEDGKNYAPIQKTAEDSKRRRRSESPIRCDTETYNNEEELLSEVRTVDDQKTETGSSNIHLNNSAQIPAINAQMIDIIQCSVTDAIQSSYQDPSVPMTLPQDVTASCQAIASQHTAMDQTLWEGKTYVPDANITTGPTVRPQDPAYKILKRDIERRKDDSHSQLDKSATNNERSASEVPSALASSESSGGKITPDEGFKTLEPLQKTEEYAGRRRYNTQTRCDTDTSNNEEGSMSEVGNTTVDDQTTEKGPTIIHLDNAAQFPAINGQMPDMTKGSVTDAIQSSCQDPSIQVTLPQVGTASCSATVLHQTVMGQSSLTEVETATADDQMTEQSPSVIHLDNTAQFSSINAQMTNMTQASVTDAIQSSCQDPSVSATLHQAGTVSCSAIALEHTGMGQSSLTGVVIATVDDQMTENSPSNIHLDNTAQIPSIDAQMTNMPHASVTDTIQSSCEDPSIQVIPPQDVSDSCLALFLQETGMGQSSLSEVGITTIDEGPSNIHLDNTAQISSANGQRTDMAQASIADAIQSSCQDPSVHVAFRQAGTASYSAIALEHTTMGQSSLTELGKATDDDQMRENSPSNINADNTAQIPSINTQMTDMTQSSVTEAIQSSCEDPSVQVTLPQNVTDSCQANALQQTVLGQSSFTGVGKATVDQQKTERDPIIIHLDSTAQIPSINAQMTDMVPAAIADAIQSSCQDESVMVTLPRVGTASCLDIASEQTGMGQSSLAELGKATVDDQMTEKGPSNIHLDNTAQFSSINAQMTNMTQAPFANNPQLSCQGSSVMVTLPQVAAASCSGIDSEQTGMDQSSLIEVGKATVDDQMTENGSIIIHLDSTAQFPSINTQMTNMTQASVTDAIQSSCQDPSVSATLHQAGIASCEAIVFQHTGMGQSSLAGVGIATVDDQMTDYGPSNIHLDNTAQIPSIDAQMTNMPHASVTDTIQSSCEDPSIQVIPPQDVSDSCLALFLQESGIGQSSLYEVGKATVDDHVTDYGPSNIHLDNTAQIPSINAQMTDMPRAAIADAIQSSCQDPSVHVAFRQAGTASYSAIASRQAGMGQSSLTELGKATVDQQMTEKGPSNIHPSNTAEIPSINTQMTDMIPASLTDAIDQSVHVRLPQVATALCQAIASQQTAMDQSSFTGVGKATVDQQMTENGPSNIHLGNLAQTPVMNAQMAGMTQSSVTDAIQSSCQDLGAMVALPQVATASCSANASQQISMYQSSLEEENSISDAIMAKGPPVRPQDPAEMRESSLGLSQPCHAASLSIAAQSSCKECQFEEKKQDDHDVVAPSTVAPNGNCVEFSSTAEPIHYPAAGPSSNVKPELVHDTTGPSSDAHPIGGDGEKSSSEEKQRSNDGSLKAKERLPCHVILSLKDDHYCEIMWKHYKILGKTRDSSREVQVGNDIFSILKQMLGDDGKFFKRAHGQDIEVDDDIASAKIIADIRRRMKNYPKWSGHPGKQTAKPKIVSSLSLKSAPATKRPPHTSKTSPPQPPSRPRIDRQSKAHTSEKVKDPPKISPRRPARKPTPNEATSNEPEPGVNDVVLNLNDERYKEIMWRHYNILGKKSPGDNSMEEDARKNIFRSLKKILGRGGIFFRKIPHGDAVFVVDNEGALQKITRDIKRRNESIHKWLKSDSSCQSQGQRSLHPKEITMENPTSTLATHAEYAQFESLAEPSRVKKSKAKSTTELLASSHLGQRIPPMKTFRTIKSVQTPNQLIQILQKATHKLNKLNRTKGKNSEVLRLYHLSELNCESKSVAAKAPTLIELAEYMESTSQRLSKWYMMYQNAIMRNFNFEKFGEDKIKNHYEVFFAVGDCYKLSECGEKALEEYFQDVGKIVVSDAANLKRRNNSRNGENLINDDEDNYLTQRCNFSETPEADKSLDYDTKDVELQKKHNHIGINADVNEEHLLCDRRKPFLRNFERNQARLVELKSKKLWDASDRLSPIEFSNVAKRVTVGVKDRMLCMVVGCDKHAQTKCDGCCTAHFRVLIFGPDKKKALKALTSTGVAQVTDNANLDKMKTASSSTLGKRKGREIEVKRRLPEFIANLSNLEPGARIYVEWAGDNNLYKATVKKTYLDKKVPMVKIHYDGKKRHILNTIPLQMVNSFIEGDNDVVKHKQAKDDTASLNVSENTLGNDKSVTNFPLLQKIYSGVVPSGGDEITQACPELGNGWYVHIVARKGLIDGPRIDRFFISPSGKKFRSVPEVERFYEMSPKEFGAITQDLTKSVPKCKEVCSINQMHLNTQSEGGSNNLGMGQQSLASKFHAVCSPISVQRDSKVSEVKAVITISPMTTVQSSENEKSLSKEPQDTSLEVLPEEKKCRLSSMSESQLSHPSSNTSSTMPCLEPPGGLAPTNRKSLLQPNEVLAMNNRVTNGQISKNTVTHSTSAFTSPASIAQPPLHHQLYQNSSNTSKRGNFPVMSDANIALQPKTNHGPSQNSSCKNDDKSRETGRPKRKPKPITRFEDEDSPSSCPTAKKTKASKSALCHCPECDRGGLSVQGIYAHYGRAHKGSLSWHNVIYSCPFCPFTSKTVSPIFQSFYELEEHVNSFHSGCDVLGPHPSKLSETFPSAQKCPSKIRQGPISRSDRVLRERKAASQASYHATEENVQQAEACGEVLATKQEPPSWTKIEYVQLLADGRKEYPRDLCRLIDTIEDQCEIQEEVVEVAREQRMKLCRNEAELESRAFDEERLSYQRGIRERARLADGERIEKQKFTEKAEQLLMRYQYENRNKRRNQEDVEVEKLCLRPVRFSSETQRHSTRQGKACKDDQCQFCKKDKGYLHHLLLESEMCEFKMDAPATQSPVFQQSTRVLNPTFRIINDDFFLQAEAADDLKDDVNDISGSKRTNQSRRDASTAKRLKTGEEKLWMLQNTKHSLEFINKYNSGLITNAWGETKKDSRGRKSC